MTTTSAPTPRAGRLARRLALGFCAGLAAVLMAATAASAHVKVSGDVPQGGGGVITFRAPTESATASTVALTVTFPEDTPITSASTQPIPGWSSTVTTKKLDTPVKTEDGTADTAVSQITWKADSTADGVPPGEFQLFNVSVYGLPKTDSIAFPALQTYSDGTTVNWNESSSGGAEPAHPAPVLTLQPAAGSTGAATDRPTAGMAAVGQGNVSGAPGTSWTGIAGLIAGVLGLILGGIALARTSRTPRAADPAARR